MDEDGVTVSVDVSDERMVNDDENDGSGDAVFESVIVVEDVADPIGDAEGVRDAADVMDEDQEGVELKEDWGVNELDGDARIVGVIECVLVAEEFDA
jgi:hypothetical protein